MLRKFRAPRLPHERTPNCLGIQANPVHIKARDGGFLFGWWIPGFQKTSSYKPTTAIVLHGWGANASLMLDIAPWIQNLGFHCLFIDARCHGLSSDTDFMSMTRFAEDLESARSWAMAHDEVDPLQMIAIGHSVGAGAALLSASRSNWAAVISLSTFAHPKDMMLRYMDEHRIPKRWIQPWMMNQLQSIIGATFDEIAPENTIQKVQCPIMLVHGRDDQDVPLYEAQRLFQKAPCGTRSVLIEGVGHDLRAAMSDLAPDVITFLEKVATHTTTAFLNDPNKRNPAQF